MQNPLRPLWLLYSGKTKNESIHHLIDVVVVVDVQVKPSMIEYPTSYYISIDRRKKEKKKKM